MFLYGLYADAGDFYAQRYGSADPFNECPCDSDRDFDASESDNSCHESPDPGTDRRGMGTGLDGSADRHSDR